MNLLKIVEKYLKKHGFDGLCNCDCGCSLEDLGCCDNITNECEPGRYKDCDKCDINIDCDAGYCITQAQ